MRRLGLLAVAVPENGGAFQYTLSMIEALEQRSDWTLTLYVPEGNAHYDDIGLPIRRVQSGRVARLAGLLLEPLLRLGTDPFEAEAAVIAPMYSHLLLRTRKPFAYTLHDLQERYYPQYFSLAQRLWRQSVHARLTSRAARVICESNYVKKDIIEAFGVDPARIAVVTAPPMARTGPPPTGATLEVVRKRYGLPETFAFYPAQFWPHKNHLRLIEAFAAVVRDVPDVHLVLTGKPRDAYEEVFALVEALGLKDRVTHVGYVDSDDLFALYLLSTLLVMPSLFESVSIPVYEAFQAGLAVASSDVVALPEQVGEAGLLFDPNDAGDIARAMKTLFEDAALRARLSAAGISHIAAMTSSAYSVELGEMLDSMVAADLR